MDIGNYGKGTVDPCDGSIILSKSCMLFEEENFYGHSEGLERTCADPELPKHREALLIIGTLGSIFVRKLSYVCTTGRTLHDALSASTSACGKYTAKRSHCSAAIMFSFFHNAYSQATESM